MTEQQKPNPEKFSANSVFAVQWKPDGDLRVIYAPILEDKNPFLFKTDNGFIDIISAANSITSDFFKKAGTMFHEQYEKIKNEKTEIEFPVVKFKITVNCEVDTKTKVITSGIATLNGTFKDMSGNSCEENLEKDVSNLWALVYNASALNVAGELCFDDYEINGHPHPNCKFGWTGCACRGGSCCDHIVLRGGKCYDEICEWGWGWLACGCARNNQVTCPDCFQTRTATLTAQLKECGIELSDDFIIHMKA